MKVSVSNLESKTIQRAEKKVSPSAASRQSFGRTSAAGEEAIKLLTKHTSALPKSLQWLGRHDGEILNSIVTGIGTAFVAPIFIAFNPFSKEDKETKMYSAWRQPISAVIATLIQIGINMKYNEHLDKLASTGLFDRADLRHCPADSYLRSVIRLERPDISNQELIKEVATRQEEAQWAQVNKLRQTMKHEVISPESFVDKEAVDAAEKNIREKYKSELSSMNKKQANKFIADKLPEEAKAAALKQVEEKAQIKFQIREWVKEAQAKGMSFTELVNKQNNLIEAARDTGGNLPETMKIAEKAAEKMSGYKDYSDIKAIGNTFDEVLQSVKIKKMVLASVEKAKVVLGQYRKWTGILISLATLPVSCGLLNYIYPRLMEKIMPNASKKKHAKKMQEVVFVKNNVTPNAKEGIK